MLLSPSPDMVKVAAGAIRALLTPSQATIGGGDAATLASADAEALMAEMGRAFTPLATTALMGLLAMGEIGRQGAIDDTGTALRSRAGAGQGQMKGYCFEVQGRGRAGRMKGYCFEVQDKGHRARVRRDLVVGHFHTSLHTFHPQVTLT